MSVLRPLCLILCLLSFGALCAEEVEYVWNVDIEVNNRDPQASDTNPTTPFRTIQAAATNALGYARAGKSVRVIIHPGLYRESVTLRDKVDETNATIKFEASDPGNVVINGTDQINGWKIGDYNIFELPWNYQSQENPTVYVEGARLVEASSPDRVRQGQVCYVRGEEPKIYLLPPKGAAVKPGSVEVSRQDVGFRAEHVDGLYLESLAFERGFDAAIDIADADGLILNNIAVEYCQGDGVRLADLGKVRIRRLIVDRCGGNGIVLRNLEQLVMSGVEVKLNNWSGSAGSLAGLQILDCNAVKLWSLKASENHGDGFVLAGSTAEAQLGKLTVVNNRSGFVCRNNAQVASVSESQFAYNAKEGLVLQGGGLYLMANVFYGNGVTQLLLAEGKSPSEIQLSRNIIVAQAGETLIDVTAPNHGLQAEKNLYDSPSKKPFSALGQALTFAQWQEVAGIDLDSYLGEAKLLDPENYAFTPKPQSPYFKMSRWPVRKLD